MRERLKLPLFFRENMILKNVFALCSPVAFILKRVKPSMHLLKDIILCICMCVYHVHGCTVFQGNLYERTAKDGMKKGIRRSSELPFCVPTNFYENIILKYIRNFCVDVVVVSVDLGTLFVVRMSTYAAELLLLPIATRSSSSLLSFSNLKSGFQKHSSVHK